MVHLEEEIEWGEEEKREGKGMVHLEEGMEKGGKRRGYRFSEC